MTFKSGTGEIFGTEDLEELDDDLRVSKGQSGQVLPCGQYKDEMDELLDEELDLEEDQLEMKSLQDE